MFEASFSILQKIVSSSFFSALLGGLFTMWATHITYKRGVKAAGAARIAKEHEIEDERQITLFNTSRLILVEISTAWRVFSDEYGSELMKLRDDEPYINTFPIGENPFPLFDSAPACLAQLPSETAGLIVRFYMRAKGMISMINMNNADTGHVHAHARAKVSELQVQLGGAGLADDALNQRLAQHYEMEARNIAAVIGMGGTANAMKGLTREIDALVSDLQKRLQNLPRPDTTIPERI